MAVAEAVNEAAFVSVDVPSFVAKWGLDETSYQAMLECSPSIQAQVAIGFAPRPGTRDVNQLFRAFLRSVGTKGGGKGGGGFCAGGKGGPAPGPPAFGGFGGRPAPAAAGPPAAAAGPIDYAGLQAFALRWGLDEAAATALLQLDPDNQRMVVKEFVPKPGTRNVNALFQGFLRSIHVGQANPRPPALTSAPVPATASRLAIAAAPMGQGGRPPPEIGSTEQITALLTTGGVDPERVLAFVHNWGLDQTCLDAFQQMEPVLQIMVITDFAPKADTRDVNQVFHAFVRSVRTRTTASGGQLSQMELTVDTAQFQNFVQTWQLNESAQATFLTLPAELQAHVMAEFAPKPNTRDVNQVFHGFVNSVRGRASGVRAGPPPGRLAVDEGQFQQFVQVWGLSEDAQAAFTQLQPHLQAQVMRDFAPKPNTRDVNQVFHGFVKSVRIRNSTGAAQAPAWTPTWAPSMGPAPRQVAPPGMPMQVAPPAAVKRPIEDMPPPNPEDIAACLHAWGVDDTGAAALECLPGEMQWRIIREFRAGEGTRDPTTLFHGFVKSVARGGGLQRPRLEYGHPGAAPAAQAAAWQPAHQELQWGPP